MDDIYDIIIVGSGAAGLFCALNFPAQYKILIITKSAIKESDSFLAQGGIATLLDEEDYSSYYEDTMKAGHYENNPKAVDIMIRSSRQIIDELISLGVDFNKENNKISYTREGGHSKYRIMYHEDITGEEITGTLLDHVLKRKNIKIMTYTQMIDIIEENNKALGIIVDHKGIRKALFSKVVILATGGIGGLFMSSTNYPHLTGDALAISLKHGIEIENINYIQIHPTTLYSKSPGRRFLISESVRGEGAILLNQNKERFCDELQPRDIVTENILKEEEKFHTDHVYLALLHRSKEEIYNRFPHIYNECLKEGYHLEKDLIPVTYAQHYFMGGIKVDMNSQTNLENLYAIGETSCNGVHGANRLASNSLLESLVFSKRAAKHIQTYIDDITVNSIKVKLPVQSLDQINDEYRNLVLQEIKRKDCEFYDKWCQQNKH